MTDQPPDRSADPIKGRGTVSNPDNRYAPYRHEAADDGWWQDSAEASIATVLREERSRTIVTTNTSPDVPFEQSINPYRGCEHGCIYCYARPSHAYWDLSPGLDFESKIIARPNAPELLRKALSDPRYQCKPITIGANTDPYQPLETNYKTTRQLIEILHEFRHPFSIITKGSLILRDLDILGAMARDQLCSAAVSVTTLDNALKRRLEPRTASPAARLRTISRLRREGIPVTMMVAPIIPAINDHEMESILEAGSEAGAESANYVLLRLPREVGEMFRQWLARHYPDRADHVMSLVRQTRGGKDYQSEFGRRMTGEGHFAELIRKRFDLASRKFGLNGGSRFELDTSQFKPANHQLTLF